MKIKKEMIKKISITSIKNILPILISFFGYIILTFTILNPSNSLELQIANIISWVGASLFLTFINLRKQLKPKEKVFVKIKKIISSIFSEKDRLGIDMLITFIGVSILLKNHIIIKFLSHLIILGYEVIIKKLIQKPKIKKERPQIFFYLFLYSIPFVTLFQLLFLKLPLLMGYQALALVFLTYGIIRNRKHLIPLSLTLGMVLIEGLYLYCNQLSVSQNLPFVIQLTTLPLVYFYVQGNNKIKMKSTTISKLFYLYITLMTIPMWIIDIPYSYLREIVTTMTILLPFALNSLYNHSNKVAQTLGIVLIILFALTSQSNLFTLMLVLTITFLLMKNRKHIFKERVKHGILIISTLIILIFQVSSWNNISSIRYLLMDNRITQASTEIVKIPKANIEEQLFGIASIKELNIEATNIDFIDILLNIGYVGISFYLLIIFYLIKNAWHDKKTFILLMILFIYSMLSGNTLTSALVAFGVSMTLKTTKEKKKILLISNMYPSKKFKHYGSFVKNVEEDLKISYQVDKVVMKKQSNKYLKLIAYLKFYLISFIKSIFNSYDIIYVHFISHSTFPVLPSIITTNYTKLYLNVHGNDVVADTKKDKKNMGRSQIALKYADKVIVPSKYYQEVMQNQYQVPEEKIFVYPSGGVNTTTIVPKDKDKCKEKLGLSKNITYYGMVSRIEKDKGWDTLLEAIFFLKRENCLRDIKIIIIGTGVEQEQFTKLIHKYHLEQDIIQKDFVYQTELVDYYNAFDLLIFPTKRKSESLGLVGLEAMACKTFVIACDLYGPKEYMIDKENGFTYQDVKDGKELAKKIKQYQNLTTRSKNEIIENAYQTSQKYDNKKIKQNLKKIFEEVD